MTPKTKTTRAKRGAGATDQPKGEPRVIRKYPNRRLYDTVESRYVTLADVRRLVLEAKQKDGKDLSQPGIQAPPLR